MLYNFKYILYKLQIPICCGIAIHENFNDLDCYHYTLLKPEGKFIDYHAIVIIGYDDDDKTFEAVNSHGEFFANRGKFKISYDYIMCKDWSYDHWIIQ